jgi:uncharacterized protein
VIAVDSNILVYAHREDSQFHSAALQRITELAEGSANWAIPWPCVHEFLAIVTHPRIYSPPTPLVHALGQVEAWLGSPTIVLLAETRAHWPTLRGLLSTGRVTGPQSMTGVWQRCAGSTGSGNCGRPIEISAVLRGLQS